MSEYWGLLPVWAKVPILACGLILGSHAVWWGGVYILAGWDTCTRIQQKPLMYECFPDSEDPAAFAKLIDQGCTIREISNSLTIGREWGKQYMNCQRAHTLSWWRRDPQPEPPEQPQEEDLEGDVIAELG